MKSVVKRLILVPFGAVTAYYHLGNMYFSGKGVVQNECEAFKWYKKGAEFKSEGAEYGIVESQFILGKFFDFGWCVEENPSEALKWYNRAAEQGHKIAQSRLFPSERKYPAFPTPESTLSYWPAPIRIVAKEMSYYYDNTLQEILYHISKLSGVGIIEVKRNCHWKIPVHKKGDVYQVSLSIFDSYDIYGEPRYGIFSYLVNVKTKQVEALDKASAETLIKSEKEFMLKQLKTSH